MATYRYGPHEQNVVQIGAGDVLELLVWAFDATTTTTPKTGLAFGSVTVTVCKPAGTSFAAWPASPGWGTGNWAEVGNGCYRLIFTGSVAAELALLDTTGPILFHLAASGAIFPEVSRTIVATAQARVDSNNLVQSDIARLGGVVQSLTDLKDFADTGYDPATHRVRANLEEIMATALTESAGAGKLAGAFVKAFNVTTPEFVSSDWTAARAALVDQLNGATDGTVAEIIKTCLTTLSNRTNKPDLASLLGIPDTAAHTLLTDIAAGAVASVTGAVGSVAGDVDGKVLGGGAGVITGTGARADLPDAPNATAVGVVADAVLDEAQGSHTGFLATNTYQAKVWLQDDDLAATPADRYTACWYKNGEPIVAGITLPLIQVVKVADGTDLVAEVAMTQVGALGYYRYFETTNRIADGTAYVAKVSATIGGAVRTWYQPVGRDS